MYKIFTITLIFCLVASTSFAQITEGLEWEWAIKPQFDDAHIFKEGLALIKQNGKWGFIDKTGKIIIQSQFELLGGIFENPIIFSEGLAKIKQNGRYGYVDRTGKTVIQYQFDKAFDFKEGLAFIEQNGKWGLIDNTGRMVVQPQFEYVSNFTEGLATIKQNGKYGYIDKTGKIVIQPQFYLAEPFSEGLAKINLNGAGYIDKNGRIVFQHQYYSTESFTEGLAPMYQKNGKWYKWGFIDKAGKIAIQPQFDYLENFSEGLAKISLNGKYGFVDKSGRIVIQPQFDNAGIFKEGLSLIKQNDKWSHIDKTGKIVIQPQDYVSEFSEGLASILQNKKWGVIDKRGKIVIQPQFDNSIYLSEGLAKVKQNGKWGYIRSISHNNNSNSNNSNTNSNNVQSKVWVLIVGISDYPGISDDLTYCDDDARNIFNFLKTPQGGMIPDNQIKLLVDQNATYENITEWSEKIFSQANENDLLLFFFSGHGAVGNFYVNDEKGNGAFLPHTTLRNIMNQSKAKKKICIADACHSGSWEKAKKELASAGKNLSNDEMIRLYYSSLTNAGNGLALFMSCQEDETSIDDRELGQGLFTYYYIQGLKGDADKNRDKIITIEELYNYVKEKVSERSLTRWKNAQTPKLKGTFDHDMPIGVRN
jgi:Caspase domain/WG containing repeat